MVHDKFKTLTGMTWEEAATLSNQLFIEADKLDEEAYSLLQNEARVSATWTEFASVKLAAEKKRTQARREWMRATRILHSLDPRCGKSITQSTH